MLRLLAFLLLSVAVISCNENGPNPEEKRMQAQGLFSAGDTVNVSRLVDGSVSFTLFKENGDTVVLTSREDVRTFTYSVTVFDTVVKPKKVVVTNPPVVQPPATGTRQNIIFEAGFDGTKPFLTENELYPQKCCSYSITQGKAPYVRSGDGSFRAESRAGERSVSDGYRPEFIPPLNTRLTDGWYGYSVYLADWKAVSGGEHIMQWHPNDGTGSAVLALWTAGNTFNVNLNASGGTSSSGLKSLANSITIKPNKWYDFVWHVVWSRDATKGKVEVWVDGVKYVDFAGVTQPTSGIPYFKIGINRWDIKDNRVLYIDAVRIGNSSATYKDVAP